MAEVEELPQYKKLSFAAAAAFFMGLASALALIHPTMWVVPVFAAALAAFGIRATFVGDPPLAGRTLAVIGLALSMCFAGWAPTRHVARKMALENQARQFGEHWFETLQSQQLKELHQLHRGPHERRPAGVTLEDAYNVQPEAPEVSNEQALLMSLEMSPLTLLEKYVEEQPLKELIAAAQRRQLSLAWKDPAPAGLAAGELLAGEPRKEAKPYSSIAFDRIVRVDKLSNQSDQVILGYTWKTNDGELDRTRRLNLTVRRFRPIGGPIAVWQQESILEP